MLFTVIDGCTPGKDGGDGIGGHSFVTIPVVESGCGICRRGGGAAATSATKASISSFLQ